MSNTTQPTVLTVEQFEKIAGALQELKAIKKSAVINPNNEAQAQGLISFLADEFITHGEEFLGCYVAVKKEYEPLINLVARVQYRVSDVIRKSTARPVVVHLPEESDE